MAAKTEPKVHLGTITGGEARETLAQNPVILLPMGSHEDQGPHAPMGDYLLAEKIAELAAIRASERGVRTLVAPVLPYGGVDWFAPMIGGIALSQSPGSRWLALQMRVDRAPYDNPKLRQAMAHAIDRQRMVDIVMNGKATIAEGFTPPGMWWFDETLKSYPHDPERAKALIAEIGPAAQVDMPLSVQPVQLYQQISQLAQEQLKSVGLKVSIKPASVSDWYPQLISGAINFLPIRWTQRPDPDGLFTYLFHSKSAANTSRYVNPEVDRLLDEARGLADQNVRARLYREAQGHMTRDLPYIPLFFSLEFAAMRDNVRNFVWIADEIPRFREVWKAA